MSASSRLVPRSKHEGSHVEDQSADPTLTQTPRCCYTAYMVISIARDGQEIGDWTDEQVRALYHNGQLLGTDNYWHEGMAEWQPLRSLIKPPVPNVSRAFEESVPVQQPLPVDKQADAPRKIGGWLILLCTILVFILPLLMACEQAYVWSQISDDNQLRSNYNIPTIQGPIFYSLFQASIAIWTIFIGWNIWTLKPKAVVYAKYYFVLIAFYPIVAIGIILIDPGFSTDPFIVLLRDSLVDSLAKGFGPGIGPSVVWYLYLKKSKRVKQTFPDQGKRKPEGSIESVKIKSRQAR